MYRYWETLEYGDEELKLDAVFLDNQDEVMVSVRSGANFPPDLDSFVRVALLEQRPPLPPKLLDSKDSRVMVGMVAPRWGARISFTGVTVDMLEDLRIRVTALSCPSLGEEAEIGFVELGLDSLHDSGREQWFAVIAHEGITSKQHRLAHQKK